MPLPHLHIRHRLPTSYRTLQPSHDHITITSRVKCYVSNIFRDATPCNMVDYYERFGGTYCVHCQGRKQRELCLFTACYSWTLKTKAVRSHEMSENFYQNGQGVPSQNVVTFVVTAVKTSDLLSFSYATRRQPSTLCTVQNHGKTSKRISGSAAVIRTRYIQNMSPQLALYIWCGKKHLIP
jgi:hypothetical protein